MNGHGEGGGVALLQMRSLGTATISMRQLGRIAALPAQFDRLLGEQVLSDARSQ